MGGSQIIILTFVILALFLFAVGTTEYIAPFFVRMKFDNISNQYLAILQAEGGISDIHRNNLISTLNSIGMTNVVISAPYSVGWGNQATLRIEADYTFRVAEDITVKVNKTKRAVYENTTKVMTLN